MNNNNQIQPVILLSPPHEETPNKLETTFLTISRKLSSLSLRSTSFLSPIEVKESNIICDDNNYYLPPSPQLSSACPTPTSERAQPILLHDKYKHYKKGKVIGRGATAKLRLLERHNQIVAIKTFYKKDKDETEKGYDKRMTSEFCISKTLDHQHVIQVFDLLKDKKNRWCSVMEYCGGGDVFSVLQQFDLSDAEIDCLFKQLLLGVQHIHSSGVAHRDIKPENLVMTTDGILKIADFGVADVVQSCFDNEPKQCQGRCGSEPYWPPDVFQSDSYDGRALDVWSCAVTWHCFIYRQIPFFKATKQDPHYVIFLESFANRTWLPLSKCNQDEQDCLYGMFHYDPVKRWTIDQCVESNWIQSISLCYQSFDRHKHHFNN